MCDFLVSKQNLTALIAEYSLNLTSLALLLGVQYAALMAIASADDDEEYQYDPEELERKIKEIQGVQIGVSNMLNRFNEDLTNVYDPVTAGKILIEGNANSKLKEVVNALGAIEDRTEGKKTYENGIYKGKHIDFEAKEDIKSKDNEIDSKIEEIEKLLSDL